MNQYYYCPTCKKSPDSLILDAFSNAICPECSTVLEIVKAEMNSGMSFGSALVVGLLVFAGLKIVDDLLG